ncbi:MAG: response regulator [Leptolinea sp.]|jgi:CheY-like chemotaxis protein|nr:response regulator [Leptolinea sp.]
MQARRILIVDDAPEFANLVKDALATMQIPLQVTIYLSGEEAWLEALKTRFDLVITDLRLPGISGTELIRRIRQRFPRIKIIAVSGLAEAGLNERTRAAGVDAFYRKPIEMPLLLTKIDNLLSDSSPNNEEPETPPAKVPMLSRLVTMPLTPKTEVVESPREAAPHNNKPGAEDLAAMKDLEQRLLKLLRESGGRGIVLTTLTGQVLYTGGVVEDLKFFPELVNTCAVLVDAVKEITRQPEDAMSLGLLALNGNRTDVFAAHISKFFVWLIFPTGSQSADASKAAAAVYASRDSLQFILNMLSILPVPGMPHPPAGKSTSQTGPMTEKNHENIELPEKQLDKKEVNEFWDAESPEKNSGPVLPETISFEKAASMGLIPSNKENKKSG